MGRDLSPPHSLNFDRTAPTAPLDREPTKISPPVQASLKALSYFEDRIRGKTEDQLSLVERTAAAELKHLRRGMYLLQNNDVLKKRIGEGLSASMVASKLADQYIEDQTMQGVLRSTFLDDGKSAALKSLGMDIGERVAGIGGDRKFIQGLTQ